MDLFYAVGFFIFGTVIGSFLNVCAYRIPRGESIAFPPSHCQQCGSEIRPLDNIPIASYVILRGRCRDCDFKISMKYPLIEAVTGILWTAAYYHFGLSIQLAYGLFFVTVLVVLSAIDYDTQRIPNKILLPAMLISALFLLLYLLKIETPPITVNSGIVWSAVGFFAGGGVLLLIAVVAPLVFKKEAMGGGDIKLAAFMGLYLGGYVMLALFIGFFLGAIVGLMLVAKDRNRAKDMLPFGPFLAAGSILTVFFGPQVWNGYLALAGLS